WIATLGGGLNRLKDGHVTAFQTKDGLFDDNVFTVLEDATGDLWMSSNKGIFRVNKQELEEYAAGRIARLACVSYGTADGMRKAECNGGYQSAGCKARDGTLWFPTIDGLATIDPERILTNPTTPPIYIEHVLVDRQP